ncbi:MAG TPA: hypothetical protein VF613_06385 [Longimicrobium sp.]|jgi:hypothetical protein
MQHLNLEALARLVDEPPVPNEAEHLRDCLVCRRELEAMRAQTAALASLPDLEPAPGAWRALEAALAAESLVRPQPARRFRPAHPYLRAAAAVLLLVTGMAAGTALLRPGSSGEVATAPVAPPTDPGSPPAAPSRPLGLAQLPVPVTREPARDSGSTGLPAVIADVPLAEAPRTARPAPTLPAARLVASRPATSRGRAPALTPEARAAARELDAAEAAYVAALRRYAEIADPSSGADPETRLSALETLVESTGRALERAPGDPVLNGYHLAVVDERDALRRQMDRAAKTAWY